MSRYPKQEWQSGIIASPFGPVSGPRLQHLDDWLDTIVSDFDAHVADVGDPHPQYLLEPAAPVIDGPVRWTAGGWVSAKLDKNQLAANAGILKSQLAALGIVDADVAGPLSYGKLNLAGAIQASDLSPALQGSIGFPPGAMVDYGGNSAPGGWLLCDGATYDGTNTTYLALWNAIGLNYGGTGQSAFKVPDYRGRTGVMKGSHIDVDTLGKSDGQAVGTRRPAHQHSHTMTLPNHLHADPGHAHSYGTYYTDGGGASTFGGSPSFRVNNPGTSLNTTGIGNPTTNPTIPGVIGQAGMVDTGGYVVVNVIIKL